MERDKYKESVIETVFFLKNRGVQTPPIAFLTGTGLGNSTASMNIAAKFRYSDIPNFPVSTVETHQGELLFGTMCNKNIMVMQGRFHLYEGYSPLEVTFPIRVMQELGVKYLVISNASGGLNLNFSTGDVMVISDHINLSGHNPLIGRNIDEWGIRFPDMTEVYDKQLAKMAINASQKAAIPVQQGVYAGLCGPSLETPAETRFLKTIGADAVGFSTVIEAIAGIHAGMKILGLATITNINNPDAPEKATIEDIIKTANQASIHVNTILKGILEKI
ncbi:MAG: purine-nucleoside phosphorylase [Desulfamplus sp.]|nr:purine-nucleoside phosphorylase [Desulfamplus sp.]